MISLSALQSDPALPAGTNGARRVPGGEGPIPAAGKPPSSTGFAALLAGADGIPAPLPGAPAMGQNGKTLPDGNVPGTIEPGDDTLHLPGQGSGGKSAFAAPASEPITQPDGLLPPAIAALALPPLSAQMPPAQPQPGITADQAQTPPNSTGPNSTAPNSAPPSAAARPIKPAAIPREAADPQIIGAKQPVQAGQAQAPALATAQVMQPVRSGASPSRRTTGQAETSAAPVATVPGTQIANLTSTRAALDLPRSVLATAIPAALTASADPVISAGVHSLAAYPPAPGAITQTPLAPRDFEALIDRLAVARETAQPGTARVVLPHAEFGQVNLRFDATYGAGANQMTVTMTSQDPDFAPAARSALAERAMASPEQTRGDAGHAGAGSSHSQGQSQSQSQSHGPMHHHARGSTSHPDRGAQANPADKSDHPAAVRKGEPRGLYA